MPAGVEQRPKVGFVLPLERWLSQSHAAGVARAPLWSQDAAQVGFPARLMVAAVDAWWARGGGAVG